MESLVFARSSINVSSVKESYNDDTYLEIAFDIVLIAKLYYFPEQNGLLVHAQSLNFFFFLKKYVMLHKFLCHPCTGAMLIFSILFQF